MPTAKIIGREILGVSSEDNIFTLINRHLYSGTNIQIDRGVVKTRPGFLRTPLGVKGPFQGATTYTPGRGVSTIQESGDDVFLAFSAGGSAYLTAYEKCGFGSTQKVPCSETGTENTHLLSAENWLVITSPTINTQWWTPGDECATTSPGAAECGNLPEDGFCQENWVHWLLNSSGVTAYVHGRVHQCIGRKIYVGDEIYKRGTKTTKDLLRMWEQMQPCYGDPQVLSTRLGEPIAAEVLPATNTANGEGDLIVYAERGIVSLNTFESPRKTESDGAGELVSKGWSFKRLKDQRAMTVTAVGRYAVAVTPRDHFFRSQYGLHSFRMGLESGTLKDEPLDNLSWQVDRLLTADKGMLSGVTTGYWIEGQRVFTTTGMQRDSSVSSDTFGTRFASFNKRVLRTQDGTPLQGWEGEWQADDLVVHRFLPNEGQDFSFIGSGPDGLEGVFIDSGLTTDRLDGVEKEISWALETGKFNFGNTTNATSLIEGYLEMEVRSRLFEVKVSVKTDKTLCWHEWKMIKGPCAPEGSCFFKGDPLGKPNERTREGAWFQFRIEGKGWVEIAAFNVDISTGDLKTNRPVCAAIN